ncbi:MAG: hypothetical protein Q9226_009057 [Calogaya cf. arnoldii]
MVKMLLLSSAWALPLFLSVPLLAKAIPAPPYLDEIDHTSDAGELQEYIDHTEYTPDIYQKLAEKGNDIWNDLLLTVQKSDTIDRNDRLQFEEFYTAEIRWSMPSDRYLWDKLKAQGIDPEYLDTWTTMDKVPREDEDAAPPYKNSFNTRDGLLIAEENFRIDDMAPKRLPWSELMYHTWTEAASYAGVKGGPISNLKTVLRQSIVNTETQAILTLMYARQRNPGLRPHVHYDWFQWDDITHAAFWDALMATDNVKGVVFLLKDHSVEIGRKIITDVWTRWDGAYPDIW